jgi:hypothetical protein
MSPNTDSFVSDGYAILRGLLERSACSFLHQYALAADRAGKLVRKDPAIPDTPSCYADPFMESILELLLPRLERHSGVFLSPTYSYFRIYKRGDTLARHTDRPSCEVSVTMNLGYVAEGPWPIWLEVNGRSVRIELEPGDAVLYRGIDLPHWRDTFVGDDLLQVFLHYVATNGPHAEWKYDKRAGLRSSDPARQLLRRLMSASAS